MKRLLVTLLISCLPLLAALRAPSGSFATYEIWIDAGSGSLGAWQVEFIDPAGAARLVGVENGDHPAFSRAPYYDPAALATGRIVIAAYSLDEDLPTGPTRVATVHVRIEDGIETKPEVSLEVAVAADGTDVSAKAWLVKGD